MIAVLRAAAHGLDVDSCLSWIPTDLLDRTWRRGDRRPGGRIEETSGFTLLLAEVDSVPELVAIAKGAILRVEGPLRSLRKEGVAVEVDFGLDVLATHPVSLCLNLEFLAVAAEIGLDVRVSAYPCNA